LMSGYPGDEISERGLVPGEFILLKKPFSLNSLATVVREALDTKLIPAEKAS
jgi:hypothetical protein